MHQQLREELAKVKTLEGIAAVSQELKLRCQVGAGPPCGGRDLVSGLLLRALWAFPGGYIQAEGGREAFRRLAFFSLDLPALLPARVSLLHMG